MSGYDSGVARMYNTKFIGLASTVRESNPSSPRPSAGSSLRNELGRSGILIGRELDITVRSNSKSANHRGLRIRRFEPQRFVRRMALAPVSTMRFRGAARVERIS